MLKKPYAPTFASGNRNTVGSGSGILQGFSGLYNEVMNPSPQEAPSTPDPEIVVPSARE